MRKIFLFALLPLLTACHPRPVDDMALADVAVKAAQKAKADSLAPDEFRKAENYYLRAKKDYTDGYYESCKKFANKARMQAEQAEYHALLKDAQIKSKNPGDVEEQPEEAPPQPGAEPPPEPEGSQ